MTSLLVAGAAVLATVILGFLGVRRAAYERVMRALDFVSEGTVASARHRLGALIYDYADRIRSGHQLFASTETISESDAAQRSDRIEDLFTVFWAATRLNAVRESLGPRAPSWFPITGGPHGLLETSVASWVKYWMAPNDSTDAPYPHGTRIQGVARSLGAMVDSDDMAGLRSLYNAWIPAAT